MSSTHEYGATIVWSGNRGQGTASYKGYDRTWEVRTPGKAVIKCSNDPLLGGDPTKANPEDLLISALAACHMLWYLHYASDAGIAVYGYSDTPLAIGETLPSGAGRFLEATLRPRITVPTGVDLDLADSIHGKIRGVCFIARSVNFPVSYAAEYAYLESKR